MGWFRAMGGAAVEYHEETVVGRADDHAGQALDYYGSRGETPLRWGGQVAERLGLEGEVTIDQYRAAFGPGGFVDPLTGKRLVSTTTPGFEIVVSAHKSVALLGVIGRADDMHAILDVETRATMDWLEASLRETGGRRGRAAVVTQTRGLVYAVTRHATSRSGDPCPHDHILIANVTYMLDTKGGYKALFSAVLRDRVEAATMHGRLASAWEATKRGYAIEADDGPSGRLRHWRIRGIPQEVCDILSKRSDEIDDYLAELEEDYDTYRARNIAARASRKFKRGIGVDELMPRWHQELEAIDWPIERLTAALHAARAAFAGPPRPLTDAEIDAIAARLMDPDSEFMARGKTFSRSRLMAEVAPLLYGHDPAELDSVLDHIVDSPHVMALIGIAAAREQMYTSTAVLEAEQVIAGCVERLTTADGPQLDPARILRAIAAQQNEIGAELTDGQYSAVNAVCGSGRAVDVIVGIAGSGKTTALDAAAAALEEAGYMVIGTATAGQAARTLADGAGVEARTMRSLLWQLDHGRIVLDRSSVVILDEAGMTADADMARLLLAVESARAKVVIVGDDRQLSAVGPGGALHALLARHPEIVTTLTENLRQRDPVEAAALLDLRDGNLDAAIGFYRGNGRITATPERTPALAGMVDAWAADVQAGADTLMVAWRRKSVGDLNRLARATARRLGWVTGPDLKTADGRLYAAGDQVVMLAPNYEGQLVTSERGRVVAVDPDREALTLLTDRGRQVTLIGSELDRDRIAHGYALTVHREQGATCDRTHYYADGGGRELAYVAMSRARHQSTVHVVADDIDQATERIRDDWARIGHETWLTPDAQPGHDPATKPATLSRKAARARLDAELDATLALPPPDVTNDLKATMATLHRLDTQREHLVAGTGPYEGTEVGRIRRDLRDLDRDLTNARAEKTQARPWQRGRWQRLVDNLENHQAARTEDWDRLGRPKVQDLDDKIETYTDRLDQLHDNIRARANWHRSHPEHAPRVRALKAAIHDLDQPQRPALAAGQDIDLTAGLADDLHDAGHSDPDAVDRLIARLHHLRDPEPERGIEPPSIGGLGL